VLVPDRPLPAAKISILACAFSGLCIAGSGYALSAGSCASCQRASALLNGFNLAFFGILFYSALLVLSVFRRLALVSWGFALASGIHGALLLMLLLHHTICVPCMVTAAGAILGAIAFFPTQPRQFVPMGLAVAGVFIVERGTAPPGQVQQR
jgi:uncharacterized membrane protein